MDQDNKSKILIVEDDDFLRALAARRLEKDGYAVSVAVDGESALASMAESKPSLILLDLILPGLNGFELLQKIKASDTLKDVPVIVFSNLGQKEDIEKAKALGAVNFLIKANFTLDDLAAKIRERLTQI